LDDAAEFGQLSSSIVLDIRNTLKVSYKGTEHQLQPKGEKVCPGGTYQSTA
jgi:hypothetical protein